MTVEIKVKLYGDCETLVSRLRRDIRSLTREEYLSVKGILSAAKSGASAGATDNEMILKNKCCYNNTSMILWSVIHALVDQNAQWRDIIYNASACAPKYSPSEGAYYIRYNYKGDSRKFVMIEDAIRNRNLIRM